MRTFERTFLDEMKNKLDVELLGVVSVDQSTPRELKDKTISLLPGVKSVVVIGKELFKEIVVLQRPSKEAGDADPGELLGPHIDYLSGRLNRANYDLAAIFRKEGYRSMPLPSVGCPTDQRFLTAIFSYKHAAELAGLGKIGRHSLLITPQFGPRVRLACLLTEASLEGSTSNQNNYCVNCDACIRGCPAQALQESKEGEVYSLNKFACRSYRQASVNCSMCMKICDQVLEPKRTDKE